VMMLIAGAGLAAAERRGGIAARLVGREGATPARARG
jgi:hypothetical protein